MYKRVCQIVSTLSVCLHDTCFEELWKCLFQADKLEKSKQRSPETVEKEHLGNLESIQQNHDNVRIRAVQDQHDDQLEEEEGLSPGKKLQNMKDLRRGGLINHKKKVKALERKNTDLETKHARMIMMLDRVADSQDNQLRHQKFEMGDGRWEMVKEQKIEVKEQKEVVVEQERKHSQELQEMDVQKAKELKELKEKQVKEMKEMMDIGEETAERLKVEHDAKVHKLEEDNKDLKFKLERFNVHWKETW